MSTKNLLATKLTKRAVLSYAAIAVAALTINSSIYSVNVGEQVRVQNSMSSTYEWVSNQGMHLKAPFVTSLERYTDVTTVAITDDEDILDTAGVTREPMDVTFIDNYGGKLELVFQLKLPTDSTKMELIHQDRKSMRNLRGSTFQTFAKDMTTLTVDQFRAQDFMQGGKGQFKQRLVDQSDRGMLVTKRERIPLEMQVADQTLDANSRTGAKTQQQFIDQVVIQTDSEGNALRRPHNLTKYGIEVVQVDLGEFHPNPDLIGYIKKIKDREKARGDVVADQGLERDKAVTEQLKGERERITAKNKLNITKDKAIIEQQQLTAVIKEQGKQAIATKLKEQDIATANLKIEKANYEASVYEAKAIKEKGFAQAAVKKADYNAIDKEVLALEVDRAKSLALYNTKMHVTMPTIVGGSGGGQGALETMSSLKVLELLGKPVTKSK